MAHPPHIPAPKDFYGCTRCEQVKPLTEFYARPKGGVDSHCKACKKDYSAKLRARQQQIPDATVPDRFWAKVDRRGADECWPWTGAKDQFGYGHMYYRGRLTKAHRVSLILDGVAVPDYDGGSAKGLVVDHKCKNESCVNPAHLRLVTQTDNCTILARPTPAYANKLKTHCKYGHAFTPDNIYRNPGNPSGRQCIACTRIRSKQYYAAMKEDAK